MTSASSASPPRRPFFQLSPFDHEPRTRLVFGPNSVDRVGELAVNLPARKVLVVTDPGIVAAGHAGHVRDRLAATGLEVAVYDRVVENPTTRCVEECTAVARAAGIDALVAVGGGSSLDTAKGCNFLLTNGGRMEDYWGAGKAPRPMLPLIAIPTTAGTGSECQSFALIAKVESHQKMACGDPKATARIAILDPSLTVSQPARVTACTGIDALTHLVETAVTRKRNALSLAYTQAGFKLAVPSFPRVLENPADLEARGAMLLAAAWAGLAIENSMLGAAHAAANPLTARFNINHGQAVGLMLPHIVRFNGRDPETLFAYADLAVAASLAGPQDDFAQAHAALVRRLEWFLNLAQLPRSLGECGVSSSALPGLAEEAARQWTAGFNPKPVTARDFLELYQAALQPREDHPAPPHSG